MGAAAPPSDPFLFTRSGAIQARGCWVIVRYGCTVKYR
jgi:hypothetical protein